MNKVAPHNIRELAAQALGYIVPPVLLSASHKAICTLKRPLVAHKLMGFTKLHLGCGNNTLDGWANIDVVSNKRVIIWDVTDGLPANSETMQFIYTEHLIEHMTLEKAKRLLTECFRVLRPEGILRLSTPNLRKLIDQYLSNELSEWSDVGWNPATSCRMLNEGMRLWGHQFVFDARELELVLKESGYSTITQVVWHESLYPELQNLECRPFHGEIIFEAMK